MKEKKINLGGPSESVCSKYQVSSTPDPGEIKTLTLAFIDLVNRVFLCGGLVYTIIWFHY